MIYHIYANRSNIGDWLSAKAIQKLIGYQNITECFCDVPFIKDTIKKLSAATEKDLVIIGGGGLLMDYFTPFWEAFKPIGDRVPFCIWGIGCCDLKQEFSLPPKSLIEDIVNKSKLTIVRDEITRSFLSNCNLPDPVPCPSINIIDAVLEKQKGILHVAHGSSVGVGVSDRISIAAKDFAEESGRKYMQTNNRISEGSEKEMEHILSMYRNADLMVSSRLHGCIIGVAMGIKVLAISGDRKVDAFMKAVHLQDYILDPSEVGSIPERLNNLNSQMSPISILQDIQNQNEIIAEQIKAIASGTIPLAFNGGTNLKLYPKDNF